MIGLRSLIIKVSIFVIIGLTMGVVEYNTLTGPHVGSTHTYHALFGGTDGVSGLHAGNPVRVSGVPVGKVTGVTLLDASHVRITFTANNDQQLTTNTWAVVRYADLLGQRYLALTESGNTPGRTIYDGATIPASQTEPALSLTALFNGFRPLFAALTPQQVNQLSGELIDVLQGQGSALGDLVQRTADLTSNLASRSDTFSQVIDSLDKLLGTVSQHDNQLATMVTSLHSLTAQLHADGPGILNSISGVDALMGSVNGLLSNVDNHNLPGDIASLNAVSGVLARNSTTVDKLINGFVSAFGDFSRVTQNGSFGNAYLCNLNIKTYGQATVNGAGVVATTGSLLASVLQLQGGNSLLSGLGLAAPVLNAINAPVPLNIPNGKVGSSNSHTKVCS